MTKSSHDRQGYYPLTRIWREGRELGVQSCVFTDERSRDEYVAANSDLPGTFYAFPAEMAMTWLEQNHGQHIANCKTTVERMG